MTATCDGCLGVTKCWVCLGRGWVEDPHGKAVACVRCFGTGKCPLCQTIAVIDLDLPSQRSRSGAAID